MNLICIYYDLVNCLSKYHWGPQWGIWELGDWAKRWEIWEIGQQIKWDMGGFGPKWEQEQGNEETMGSTCLGAGILAEKSGRLGDSDPHRRPQHSM